MQIFAAQTNCPLPRLAHERVHLHLSFGDFDGTVALVALPKAQEA